MDRNWLNDLETWFAGYCRSFQGNDAEANRNYSLKELHTRKVVENIRLLASSAGLADGRLAMAEAVALLHDVGRFEQYRRHRTFSDSKSENHAALGVQVIHENRLLEGLTNGEADTILHAVALHNLFKVPLTLSGEDRLYVNLIRDADKLDIWRVFVEQSMLPGDEQASAANLGLPDLPECSREVIDCIERFEMVNLSMLRSVNDFKLLQLSWVFDLHFPESFRVARYKGDLSRLASTVPYSARVEHAVRTVWSHLDSRC